MLSQFLLMVILFRHGLLLFVKVEGCLFYFEIGWGTEFLDSAVLFLR